MVKPMRIGVGIVRCLPAVALSGLLGCASKWSPPAAPVAPPPRATAPGAPTTPATRGAAAVRTDSEVWAALAPKAGGLTASTAAQQAIQNAPSVEAASEETALVHARARRTLSQFVPDIALEASYRRTNSIDFDFSAGGFSVGALNAGALSVGTCPDGVTNNCVVDSAGSQVAAVAPEPFEIPVDNYALQATVTVPISLYVLSLMPARRSTQADLAAAELRRTAEERLVAVNARIAFYDWARAQAQLVVVRESLAAARARLEDAKLGLDAGTITTADQLALQSAVATAEVAVADAESFLRLAETRLKVTIAWDGPLQLGEDLAAAVDTPESFGSVEDLVVYAKQNRAEIRAVLKAREARVEASDGSAQGMYPRLDAIANVTHANPNQGFFPPGPEWNTSWFVGLSVTWQLSGLLNTQAEVWELDANERVLRTQQTTLERAVELEVKEAWEAWERADAAASISTTELESALATYDQRVTLFKGGEATSTDVLEAELQRSNATLRNVNAQIDRRIALARLRYAAALPAEGESAQ